MQVSSSYSKAPENIELPPIKSALKTQPAPTELEFNLKKLSDLSHSDKEMIEL